MAELSSYFAVMSSDPKDIIRALQTKGFTSVHATNGVYGAAPDLIVPSTVAGFQYIHDAHPDRDAALVIAVNSDKSVAESGTGVTVANQFERARTIVKAVAAQLPTRHVFYTFYDEQDPRVLYRALADAGIKGSSLHKWAYGTDENAKPILGAENFETVYGFPLPGKIAHIKPAFWDVTPEGQQGTVRVVDLTKPQEPQNRPYISADNKILVPVPAYLQRHAATGVPVTGVKPSANTI